MNALATITVVWAFIRHVGRAGKALASDRRLPRWLRITLAIACLPIPGPMDNAVQVLVLLIVAVWYRPVLVDSWTATYAQ